MPGAAPQHYEEQAAEAERALETALAAFNSPDPAVLLESLPHLERAVSLLRLLIDQPLPREGGGGLAEVAQRLRNRTVTLRDLLRQTAAFYQERAARRGHGALHYAADGSSCLAAAATLTEG